MLPGGVGLPLILVEEGRLGLVAARFLGGEVDDDLESLTALLHCLHRAFEHHLERRQPLVDVVLGLVPQRPGRRLGVVDEGLSPPAVSQQLLALERETGASLIDRAGRQVRLTA